MSTLIDSAIKRLYQYVDARIDDVRSFRAIVTGTSSGMVTIRRIHSTSGETALRARCAGFELAVSDEVLCAPMADGIPVVVAKLQRATPSGSFTLPVSLQVGGSSGATIRTGSGTPEGAVIGNVGDIYLRTNGGSGTIIYEKASGAATNTGWVANVAAVTSEFIPFVRTAFDDTLNSTSSTGTYTTQVSTTFTLPTGTWTVEAMGWGRIATDADTNVNIRIVIDGTNGTAVARSGPTTFAAPGGAHSSKSSVASGSRTVSLQFKAATADTVYMSNAFLLVNAYRTA